MCIYTQHNFLCEHIKAKKMMMKMKLLRLGNWGSALTAGTCRDMSGHVGILGIKLHWIPFFQSGYLSKRVKHIAIGLFEHRVAI